MGDRDGGGGEREKTERDRKRQREKKGREGERDKRLLIITLMLPFLVDKSISLSTRSPTLTCSVRGGKRGLVTY